MKVAITGAGGMLGKALARTFRDRDLLLLPHSVLDIADLDKTVRVLRDAKPEFVIHAAAFTDVDGCESQRDRALLVNGIGARNVAIGCEETGARLVYISSDYIFDGAKGTPYNEWDAPNPQSVYGLSKLLGERYTASFCRRHYIVRTSWLFGADGKNFVDTVLRLLREKDRLEIVNDQTGCPTLTDDLAQKIRELSEKGYGAYHITNSGSCTWHGFASKIAALVGIRKEIVPISTAQLNRPAPRPRYSVLDNTLLRLEGISPARPWEEAVKKYLATVL